ncbi:hypothetical protein BKP44_16005 [Formosa algae]|nr:hypothetical protein BKP44_16005 [Formosa algae]
MKKTLKFIHLKLKYKRLVKFDFSVNIGLNSVFEGMNKLYPNSYFDGKLGFGSYIGPNSYIVGKVGKYVSIAPDVKVVYGKHPYTTPHVSTSPVFYSLQKQNGYSFTTEQRFDEYAYYDKENKIPVVIGNDCWIGERAILIGGIKLGDGAVILAGAVVTHSVAPYAIVGGVPAKLIKYRYPSDTIDYLLKFKWWNKDVEWLKKNIDKINNIEDLEKIKI